MEWPWTRNPRSILEVIHVDGRQTNKTNCEQTKANVDTRNNLIRKLVDGKRKYGPHISPAPKVHTWRVETLRQTSGKKRALETKEQNR